MKPRRGFALVAALWLLVALSALGLEFSMAARDRRLSAINSVDEARATAAAHAGLETTRGRLDARLRPPAGQFGRGHRPNSEDQLDPWFGARFADTTRIGIERYAVAVRDAGTTVNLNLATEDELRRLLLALRMDAGHADRLAQSIADWRDSDDSHRARGAERDEYVRAGSLFLPANRPFRSTVELRRVLDLNDRDYDLIAPFVSVRGSGRVNLRSADRAVLMSLPGIGEEAAAVIVRLRRSPSSPLTIDQVQQKLSSGGRIAMLEHLPLLTARTVNQTRELEVISDGWVDGAAVRVRVSALLVRADPTAMVVGRRIE